MTPLFKKRLRKLIAFLLLGFIILFLFRLMYGYTKDTDYEPPINTSFRGGSFSKKNYASNKYIAKGSGSSQAPIKMDQKYEKIAEINTGSFDFENDEKTARSKVENYKALIQFEHKSGNDGQRKLSLVIGVPPDNFDKLYSDLIKIGKVQAKQITKKDKTNEYKELNAKKASLEKIRNSLIDLKSKGGKIEEFMQLENRILDIEQQLQDLGVSLGDFDDENEFCTVQFSLSEGKKVSISTMHRIKVALEWTIKFYLRIMTMLFFLTLFSYFILLSIDKLKLLQRVFNSDEIE